MPDEPPARPPRNSLTWTERRHGISDSLGEPASLHKWARYAFIFVLMIALTALGLRALNHYTNQESAAFEVENKSSTAESEPAPLVVLSQIIGAAEYYGTKQTWLPLRKTTILEPGDRVRTGAESYVTLQLLGRHSVRLDTNTEVKLLSLVTNSSLAEQGEISIIQKTGQVYHRTDQNGLSYHISTPHLNFSFTEGAVVSQVLNEDTSSVIRVVQGDGTVAWTDQALRLGEGDEVTVDSDQTDLALTRTPLDFFKTPWMQANRAIDLSLALPLGRMADLDPPPLQIVSPKAGATSQVVDLLLTGQSEPTARVTVNDQAAVLNAAGEFQTSLKLSAGLNTIRVTATDLSGNQNELSFGVTYQSSPPEDAETSNPPEQPATPPVGNPPVSTTIPAAAAPASVSIESLTAEARPNGSVAVNWTSSDPSVLRYGLAWSKSNSAPSRCSADPEVMSVSVSATGYSVTGLSAGTWTIGVSPQQTGNNSCAGLKIVTVTLPE